MTASLDPTGGRARHRGRAWRCSLRWELAPLRRHLAARAGRTVTITEMAAAIGVSRRTVHRWAHNGLTDRAADEVAVRLGTVPPVIWGTAEWCAAATGPTSAIRARLAGPGLGTHQRRSQRARAAVSDLAVASAPCSDKPNERRPS